MSEITVRGMAASLARPEADPYAVYLATLQSPLSKHTMARCLDGIARMLADDDEATGRGQPWHAIRYPHVAELRSRLSGRGHSPASVNKHLSALRGVTRQAWLLGLMEADDYMRIQEVKNVKGRREPAGRSVHADETSALIGACLTDDSNPAAGLRDAALIALLQSAGIRIAEAAGALAEKYDPGERSLRLIGKGDNERTVFVSPSGALHVERWMSLAGRRRGPLLTSVDRHGNIGTGAVTPTALASRLALRRKQAGLAPLSPHDYRRTFAGDLLDSGADLARVQLAMGHKRPETTARYDRRPLRGVRDAVDRLPELPAPGREGRTSASCSPDAGTTPTDAG